MSGHLSAPSGILREVMRKVEEAAGVTCLAALKRSGPLGSAEFPQQRFPYFKKGGK